MLESGLYNNITHHVLEALVLLFLVIGGLELLIKHLQGLLICVNNLRQEVKSWKKTEKDKA